VESDAGSRRDPPNLPGRFTGTGIKFSLNFITTKLSKEVAPDTALTQGDFIIGHRVRRSVL
jgi:hypothetical protein